MRLRRAAIVGVVVAGAGVLWLSRDRGRYPVADPAVVFVDSLSYSGSAIALVLALAVAARLGKPTFGRDVAVAALASLALVPLGYEAVVFANGWLDTAPPAEQTVRLVRATDRGVLEVESWRGSGDVQRLPRRWRALAAAPDSLVTLTTHSGWLGHEWLSGARVLPPLLSERVAATTSVAPEPATPAEPPAAEPTPSPGPSHPFGETAPLSALTTTPAREPVADEPRDAAGASAAEMHRKRAYELAMRHQIVSALAEYDRAIAAEPGNAENYFRRAMTRQGPDETDATVADLTKTLELDPRHVAAHWELARIYARQRQLHLSQPLVEELATLTPDDAEVQYARAWHFAHQQNRPAELEALRRGCELGSQKSCERRRLLETRR